MHSRLFLQLKPLAQKKVDNRQELFFLNSVPFDQRRNHATCIDSFPNLLCQEDPTSSRHYIIAKRART